MPQFTNTATLKYLNNITTLSNTVTGTILDVLSVSKTAVQEDYTAGSSITYIVSLTNSSTAPLTNVTVTDDLGGYTFLTGTVYPLTYTDGSVKMYVNGVLDAQPTTAAGPPLVFSGITVPAQGNVMLIYETTTNGYAPLAESSDITNTVTVTGSGITEPATSSETVNVENTPELSVSKALSPATVSDNEQITYTFTIQNNGNTAADASANISLTDTFAPILNPISVTFNGTPWASGTNYTYSTVTGEFATLDGQITVPAATSTQDPVDGTWSVTPGISTLVVTGTI